MITIKRDAAIGDILMVTPILQALIKKHGRVSLRVTPALHERMHALLDCPVFRIVKECDGEEIDLNNAYELRPHLHPVEAYCEVAGIDIAETTAAFCKTDHVLGVHFDVVIHPTISWRNRTLPREFWRDLVVMFQENGLTVACVAQNSKEMIPGCDAVYLAQPLERVAGLIRFGAKLFIGGDSGPLHLAAATKTPIIGLFTIALAERREPWGRDPKTFIGMNAPIDCVGCLHDAPAPVRFLECPAGIDYKCTESFSIKSVYDAACTLLGIYE